MSEESTKNLDKDNFITRRVVYYILGVIEVLFVFRFLFKLLGANPNSDFVSFIYSVTQVFLAPFDAIFRPTTTPEFGTIVEFNTITAMIVYALAAWGIVKLFYIILHGRNKYQNWTSPHWNEFATKII